MFRLPPHAVALLCAATLLATAVFAGRGSLLAAAGAAAALIGVGLLLCPARVRSVLREAAALALIVAAATLFLTAHACAAEAVAAGGVLTLPIGDYAVEAAKIALSVLIPYAVVWIGKEVAKVSPALRKSFTDERIDRMVRLAGDFALAAAEGCARGRTVPVTMGSTLVAAGVARAINSSPAWQVAAAGGAAGIAEKVFRDLPLDPAASAENTLAPALVRLGLAPRA